MAGEAPALQQATDCPLARACASRYHQTKCLPRTPLRNLPFMSTRWFLRIGPMSALSTWKASPPETLRLTLAPTWDEWDRAHLPFARVVARHGRTISGWAALSRVSQRACYAGVAELSVYVAGWARGKRIGTALMEAAIEAAEQAGIWTLQGSVFAENVASLKLCEAAGFRQVGVREKIGKSAGKWRDTVLVERRSKRVGME